MSGPEFFFVTQAGILTLGLLTVPADLLGGAGRAWLFPLVINAGLTFFAAWVFVQLSLTFPGQISFAYLPRIFGPIGTWLIYALYFFFHMYLLAVGTQSFVLSLHPHVLFFTPHTVILAVFTLTAAYLAGLGLKGLARATVVVVPVSLVMFLFPLLLSFAHAEAVNLWPSLSEGAGPILGTATQVYYPFIAFDLVLLYAAFWDVPLRRARLIYWSLALTVLLLFVYVIAVVGTLGVEAPRRLVWPGLFLAETVRFPGFFLERMGFLVIISQMLLGCLFIAVHLWAVPLTLMQQLRLPRAAYRPLVWAFALVAFGGSLLIGNQQQIERQMRLIVSPAGLVAVVVIPLITLIVARIRGFKPDVAALAKIGGPSAGAPAPPAPPAAARTAPTGDAPPAGDKGASGRKSRRAGRTRRAGRGRAPARR
jgi:spore germination protein